MKCAFVCWRPFQIFNSINFIYHDIENTKENSDIFILDIPDNIKCLKGLNDIHLFKNIYLFSKKNEKNELKARIQLFKDYMFPYKAITRDLTQESKNIKLNNYEIIIGSGFLGFFLHLIELNKKARVIFLEDGMISYQGDERIVRKKRILNVVLNKIFHKGDLCVSIESLYLNNVNFKATYYPYPTKPMPEIDKETLKLLKHVFHCEENNAYSKKIIFLQQPLTAEPCIAPDINEKVTKILSRIREKIILRRHPNETNNLPFAFEEEVNRVMWEIRANEIDKNYVLIGYFSTAQMTPYILYEKAPTLILLYRLILRKSSIRYKSIDDLIKRFKMIYPGEIIIPESLIELLTLIKQL